MWIFILSMNMNIAGDYFENIAYTVKLISRQIQFEKSMLNRNNDEICHNRAQTAYYQTFNIKIYITYTSDG